MKFAFLDGRMSCATHIFDCIAMWRYFPCMFSIKVDYSLSIKSWFNLSVMGGRVWQVLRCGACVNASCIERNLIWFWKILICCSLSITIVSWRITRINGYVLSNSPHKLMRDGIIISYTQR
jgi:hypothetical protein